MRKYHGSCHCGAVKFEVDAEISQLDRCNCSICTKKGGVFIRVPSDRFRLVQGKDDLSLYRFNKMIAKHYFCKHCGIHSFAHPRSAPELYLINVRCLDDFDLDSSVHDVNLFDGKNWETAFAARSKADWGFG